MKAIDSNPTNISIAIVYCLFGVVSFYVLKITARYFMTQGRTSETATRKIDGKKISGRYLKEVNFSKVFIKTYLLKNTLIGSIINKNKKYLLKQILILSCIGVSCFNINSYIIWPWAVGLSLAIITFCISQIVIPIFSGGGTPNELFDKSQIGQHIIEPQNIGSMEIQINTRIQLTISVHRQQCLSKESQVRLQQAKQLKQPSLELLFIILLAFVSQILICICAVKLGLSVSNSGVLNLISFSISLLIDQGIARIGAGLISYIVCFGLQKSQTLNLLENSIFCKYCSQAIVQDLRRVHEQAQIAIKDNKVANENHLPIRVMDDTGEKIICENHFSYNEEIVVDQALVPNSVNLHDQALFQQKQEEDQSKAQQQVKTPVQKRVQQSQQEYMEKKQSKIDNQDDTDYFQLFAHDIETFTEQIDNSDQIPEKPKKIKKRKLRQQDKFKSDPLLYLPFEEHKLSHRNSVNHELKQFENTLCFSKQKCSIEDNILSHIEVLECLDDTIMTEEEHQIGTILNEKNLNIKTLTLNQKAQIPPTSRPNYSATKRSLSKETVNVKKKSPYLVDLQSQAVRPQKAKKHQLNKINKQNANQTNQSFMPQMTIQGSRISQKQFNNIGNNSNKGQILARQ